MSGDHRFTFGETERVEVVRRGVLGGDRVAIDGGEPMEDAEAVALALDLLLAAGKDDAAVAARDAMSTGDEWRVVDRADLSVVGRYPSRSAAEASRDISQFGHLFKIVPSDEGGAA